jgi:hypothetical protein
VALQPGFTVKYYADAISFIGVGLDFAQPHVRHKIALDVVGAECDAERLGLQRMLGQVALPPSR